MEVIATENAYNGETDFAIVKMSQWELRRLFTGEMHRKVCLKPGYKIEIHERFDHALNIESNVAAAVALPNRLRTLADMLEMNHPALEGLVANAEQVESNES